MCWYYCKHTRIKQLLFQRLCLFILISLCIVTTLFQALMHSFSVPSENLFQSPLTKNPLLYMEQNLDTRSIPHCMAAAVHSPFELQWVKEMSWCICMFREAAATNIIYFTIYTKCIYYIAVHPPFQVMWVED